MAGIVFGAIVVAVLAFLGFQEVRLWRVERSDEGEAGPATRRLRRRMLGLLFLLFVLLLLFFPSWDGMSGPMLLARIAGIFLFCGVAVLIALWDMRCIVDEAHRKTVRDLRETLQCLDDSVDASQAEKGIAGDHEESS